MEIEQWWWFSVSADVLRMPAIATPDEVRPRIVDVRRAHQGETQPVKLINLVATGYYRRSWRTNVV